MKRTCVGIWKCKKCTRVIAGGAWVPRYISYRETYIYIYCTVLQQLLL